MPYKTQNNASGPGAQPDPTVQENTTSNQKIMGDRGSAYNTDKENPKWSKHTIGNPQDKASKVTVEVNSLMLLIQKIWPSL